MELSLGCYQACEQRQYLSQSQRLGLKQLVLIENRLRHPEYPNAIKGLEGLQTAHQILQEREAVGVLIGGLAEAVWNQRREQGDLYEHKDVDVMVLDDCFQLSEKFEGGIDWWLPNGGRIKVSRRGGATSSEQEQKWWRNGYDALLSFGARIDYPLDPGLYIPGSDWVVNMRESETNAHVDHDRVDVEIDDQVFEKFIDKIRQRVRTRLPGFIREFFDGYVLSPHYERDYRKQDCLELIEFDLPTLVGINLFEGRVIDPRTE